MSFGEEHNNTKPVFFLYPQLEKSVILPKKPAKKFFLCHTQMLNKTVQNRLDELRIETKAVISLRMKGTYRLYGYRIGNVFYILWFDTNHGDNDTCVCRSRKKHT